MLPTLRSVDLKLSNPVKGLRGGVLPDPALLLADQAITVAKRVFFSFVFGVSFLLGFFWQGLVSVTSKPDYSDTFYVPFKMIW